MKELKDSSFALLLNTIITKMDNKKIGLIVILIAIIVLALFFLIDKSSNVVPNQDGKEIVTDAPSASTATKPGSNVIDGPKTGIVSDIDSSKVTPVSPASEKEINKLQELLDDDEKHEAALEQALKMVKAGDADQILAALDAFRWLGGRESKIALVELISQGGDLASRATEILQSIFQADAIDDDRDFDTDVWIDAFNVLPDDAEREAFLILLTLNPTEICAPVLIKLWQDSQDNDVKDMLKEYFESIAEGEEILNVNEAQKWLDNYLKEQEQNDDGNDD